MPPPSCGASGAWNASLAFSNFSWDISPDTAASLTARRLISMKEGILLTGVPSLTSLSRSP